MNIPIIIKTKPISYKQNIFKITKGVEIRGHKEYDPLELKIIDELDPKKWFNEVHHFVFNFNIRRQHQINYKKVIIQIQTIDDDRIRLIDCFPIQMFDNIITVVFDAIEEEPIKYGRR